jgi:hypothetical protein
MAKLGDDVENFIDESMPFLFEKLGDLNALTEHGCLTVAQCALLVPSILTSKKSGDASEIAAHYVQLALLDIANGELSTKHPETLLPFSQYLRMMEAGMYGINGESLPMPTADWLVSLEEAERWLQSKEIPTNFEGLRAELAERNKAPAQTPATPAPVEDVGATGEPTGPLPLTTGDIAFCFDGLHWDEDGWKKPLGDKPKWLEACIVIPGQRGVSAARWNPVLIGAELVKREYAKLNSVRSKFQTKPLLTPWREEWKTYEADNFDKE